jgi:hypothetical protein
MPVSCEEVGTGLLTKLSTTNRLGSGGLRSASSVEREEAGGGKYVRVVTKRYLRLQY